LSTPKGDSGISFFLAKWRHELELVTDSDIRWARQAVSTSYFSSTSGLRVIWVLQEVIPLIRFFAKSRHKFELVADSDTHCNRE